MRVLNEVGGLSTEETVRSPLHGRCNGGLVSKQEMTQMMTSSTLDRAVPVSPWGQDLGTRDRHFYPEHPWYPIFSLAVFHVIKSEFTASAAQ